MDPFGRKIDYLRISVTDRWQRSVVSTACRRVTRAGKAKPDHLTADEIVRVVPVAAGLGFPQIPADRRRTTRARGRAEIVRAMKAISRRWNASGFPQRHETGRRSAKPLREAGLRHGEREPRRAGPGDLPPHHGGDVARALAGIARRWTQVLNA